MKFHQFIFKFLAVLSLIAAGMLVLRFGLSLKLSHWYLAWNLFLAWVPYLISFGMYSWDSKKRLPFIPTILLTGIWVLFYPNAAYLVTDLIHLEHIPPVPFWYDTALLGLFAVLGVLIAIASVDQIYEVVKKHFSSRLTLMIMTGLSLLSGFGLYLGRVERWNSWQVLTYPTAILSDSLNILLNPSNYLLLTIFCVFSLCITIGSSFFFQTLKKHKLI